VINALAGGMEIVNREAAHLAVVSDPREYAKQLRQIAGPYATTPGPRRATRGC